MRLHALTFLYCALACLLGLPLAGASLSVYDDALFDNPPANTSLTRFCGFSSLPCVGSEPIPNLPLSVTYDTYAVANYGVLKAYGSESISAGPMLPGPIVTEAAAGGTAIFEDTFTFLGQPTGTPGIFVPSFTITGSGLASANGYATYGLWAQLPASNQTYYIADNVSLATNPNIAITFGVPIDIYFNFNAAAAIGPFFAPGEFVTADYSDTAMLSEITVLNADGQPVPVIIESGSGTTYTADGVVPEPSSFALGIIGFCGLAGLLHRSRHILATRD